MSEQKAPVLTVPGFWSRTSWIQICYGIWVNQLFILVGLSLGFSAVTISQLTEEFDTTVSQEALFVSIVSLSPPIGSIISGFVVDRLGRRITFILSGIPFVAGWSCLGFASKSIQVIIGRVITGIGVGIALSTARTFSTEISLPNIRGFIGVMPTQTIAIGVTVQATFGAIYEWRILCYIAIIYSAYLTVLNIFLPESPYYVLMKGTLEETKKSLRKFRAKDYDIDAEMETLRQYKEKKQLHPLNMKEYFLSLFLPSSYIPCIIITVYFAFGQMSAVSILTFYAVDIQKDANSSVNHYLGNIVFGVTRFLSGVLVMIFIVKVPRRPLAIISAFVLGTITTFTGVFVLVYKQPSVVPFIGFTMFVMASTAGFTTLPPMMLFELIPLEVRGLLGGIVVALFNLMIFGVNTAYPYMLIYVGFPQTLIGCGISAFLGSLYLYFFLPETKDLSLQEIEEQYRSRNSNVRSDRRDQSAPELN